MMRSGKTYLLNGVSKMSSSYAQGFRSMGIMTCVPGSKKAACVNYSMGERAGESGCEHLAYKERAIGFFVISSAKQIGFIVIKCWLYQAAEPGFSDAQYRRRPTGSSYSVV